VLRRVWSLIVCEFGERILLGYIGQTGMSDLPFLLPHPDLSSNSDLFAENKNVRGEPYVNSSYATKVAMNNLRFFGRPVGLPQNDHQCNLYSYLKASMGSKFEAFLAG
jgi:hypothetical protein